MASSIGVAAGHDAELAVAAVGEGPDVAGVVAVGAHDVDDALADLVLGPGEVHVERLAGAEEALDVLVEAEHGRLSLDGVGADALECTAPVVQHVGEHVDLRFVPRDELPVEPDVCRLLHVLLQAARERTRVAFRAPPLSSRRMRGRVQFRPEPLHPFPERDVREHHECPPRYEPRRRDEGGTVYIGRFDESNGFQVLMHDVDIWEPKEGEDPEHWIRETATYGVDVKQRDCRFDASVVERWRPLGEVEKLYRVTAFARDGSVERFGPVMLEPMAGRVRLWQNAPNPFGASTLIAFELDRSQKVQLDVIDVSGRKVTTLVAENMPQGRHEVEWDGTDSGGRAAAAGLYFYRIQTADRMISRRMLLVR